MKSPLVKLKKWKNYRKSVNELSALSNKDLNDLGIHRCDIKRVCKQSVL